MDTEEADLWMALERTDQMRREDCAAGCAPDFPGLISGARGYAG